MVKWAKLSGIIHFKRRAAVVAVSLVVLGLISYGLTTVFFNTNKSSDLANNDGAAPNQVEDVLSKATNELIEKKDFDLYIGQQRSLASQYLSNNDTPNAKRILDMILEKVPEDKIPVDVYMDFWNLAKVSGDDAGRKTYASKVVNVLKSQKDPNQAQIDMWAKEL